MKHYTSIGQGKTKTIEPLYFIIDQDKELEIGQSIFLNDRPVKIKSLVRREGKRLTGITIERF